METVAPAALCLGILAVLAFVLVRFQRSPDEDLDRAVHVVNGPDGRPHLVRLRKPASPKG